MYSLYYPKFPLARTKVLDIGVLKPYDSLHFISQNLKAGTLPKPKIPCEFNLGDIILGMHIIEEDCKEDKTDINEYLPVSMF